MTPIKLIHAVAGATLSIGLLLGATPAAVAGQPSFSAMYVFGDSLSDVGRVFAATGGLYPPAPYYDGRFSNGPVAAEYVAAGLGLAPGSFVDLAVGGATTGTGGSLGAGTGMLSQLAGYQFSLGSGGTADASALYMVWGGANDLRNNLSIDTAVSNLSSIVSTLHSLGARNFLLPNLPDLGLIPESIEGGISASRSADTQSFNAKLAMAYGTLAAQWTDENFFYYDTAAAQGAIINGAPGNGFTNVTSACLNASTLAVCSTPDSYLYWDQIHPTAVAHAILGAGMLAAVPEPQTMLLMATGLLVLLGKARRRTAASRGG